MSELQKTANLLMLAASLPQSGLNALPQDSPQAVLARRVFNIAKTMLSQAEDETLNVRPDNPRAILVKIEGGEMIWGTANIPE